MSGPERTLIAYFQVWPDELDRLAEAIHQAPTRPPTPGAVRFLAATERGGLFNLAFAFEAENRGPIGGSRALHLASALSRKAVWRHPSGGWWATAPASESPPADEVFDAVADADGLLILRAMDGWNLIGVDSHETWHAISMTFLRRRLYNRYSHDSAWRSREALDLASLVFGTHRAEDIEGTSETYNIPCLALGDWLDAAQAAGGALEATPASRLAGVVHYGALVWRDARFAGNGWQAGSLESALRQVALMASAVPH